MARLDREELTRRLEFSERKRTLLQKMRKQRTMEEDTFLWSMADLMTLLLIFFILFYSLTVNKAVTTKNDFSQDQSLLQIEKPSSWRDLPKAKSPASPSLPKVPQSVSPVEYQELNPREGENGKTVEELEREVLSTLEEGERGAFSVRWDQSRLVLVLGERITFRVGEAELLLDFEPALSRIADFIAHKEGYEVRVLGHTDNTPIHNTQFPSNWELSAARAVDVAKFLIENGVGPERVSIQGYSEYRPVYANTTPENRQANRRVEISLIREEGTKPLYEPSKHGPSASTHAQ
jgi:chemotaxis protein MotB